MPGFRDAHWIWTGVAVVAVLQWGLILHLLARRTKSPNATLAWMWAMLLFPGPGGLFYLLVGSDRVTRRHLHLSRDLDAKFKVPERRRGRGSLASIPELEKVNGFGPTPGNHVDILPDGTSFFPLLLETIRSAQHHLHVQFYIWNTDRTGRKVRDALTEAARRGVEVRLLLDEIGSLKTTRRFFAETLEAGAKFAWFGTFSPVRGRFHLNLRNHRKLVIADGLVALTGGMNVGDEYWGGSDGSPPYRDLHVRVRGPAVAQLSEVFAQDWYFASDEALHQDNYYPPCPGPEGTADVQVVPGGPDNELNEVQLTTLTVLQRAKHRIRLVTPYFVPEHPVVIALQLAAMRGVDVQILVPAECDHTYLNHVTRSYYHELLPYGVRIHEYLPRMLHAKFMTVDGLYSMCGSANMDVRSLRINFELNLVLSSESLAGRLEKMFENDISEAREVTEEAYRQRPLSHKALEAICRPLASIL